VRSYHLSEDLESISVDGSIDKEKADEKSARQQTKDSKSLSKKQTHADKKKKDAKGGSREQKMDDMQAKADASSAEPKEGADVEARRKKKKKKKKQVSLKSLKHGQEDGKSAVWSQDSIDGSQDGGDGPAIVQREVQRRPRDYRENR
jgi:hypothetical protein